MSDIMADINKRITDAESERNAANAKLRELKETIAKNHIVLHKGKAYMFVGTGGYNGYKCAQCPFMDPTSADSYKCEIGRDMGRCADAGGRQDSGARKQERVD